MLPASAQAEEGGVMMPSVRFSGGTRIGVDRDAGDVHPEFDVDVGATLFAFRAHGDQLTAPALFIIPEAGYTGSFVDLHLFNLGCDVGGGTPLFFGTVRPRLLAGSSEGASALVLGMRSSAVFHGFYDMFTLEIGHEFLWYRGDFHHSVNVAAGVNFMAILTAVLADSSSRW
ncbi:MAG: hypothetical protein U0271_09130 [Polyangiaceae bacterium]